MSVRGKKHGSLFLFSDGALFNQIQTELDYKTMFPKSSVDTHSFRIGGASLAAQSGVPP